MDVGINPHPHFLHLDGVAIMEFSSSFSEEITARSSINQRRRNVQHSGQFFPHQQVHHRQQQPDRNHHIHYHQQQYSHFRNYRPRWFDVHDIISYEQLLELQERIGNINIGLSEESITTCLKTRTVTSGDGNDEEIFNETCIVCQDEYKENDTIGTLKCGHEYHRDCIKEWLLLKNVCPICKRPAQ